MAQPLEWYQGLVGRNINSLTPEEIANLENYEAVRGSYGQPRGISGGNEGGPDGGIYSQPAWMTQGMGSRDRFNGTSFLLNMGQDGTITSGQMQPDDNSLRDFAYWAAGSALIGYGAVAMGAGAGASAGGAAAGTGAGGTAAGVGTGAGVAGGTTAAGGTVGAGTVAQGAGALGAAGSAVGGGGGGDAAAAGYNNAGGMDDVAAMQGAASGMQGGANHNWAGMNPQQQTSFIEQLGSGIANQFKNPDGSWNLGKIGSLGAALYSGYRNDQNQDKLMDWANSTSPDLDFYNQKLRESYENPSIFFQGADYKAAQDVVHNKLQRGDAAGGVLANDANRQNELQKFASSSLQGYRQQLGSIVGQQQNARAGMSGTYQQGLHSDPYAPLFTWMGGETNKPGGTAPPPNKPLSWMGG